MLNFKVSLGFALKKIIKKILGPPDLWARQTRHICPIFADLKCHFTYVRPPYLVLQNCRKLRVNGVMFI